MGKVRAGLVGWPLLLALGTAGCGGGGGQVAGTPVAPPPSTITNTSYVRAADLSASDFSLSAASAHYTSGMVDGGTSRLGSDVRIAFSKFANTYTLTAADGSALTFGPGEQNPPTGGAGVQSWTRKGATRTDTLNLQSPPATTMTYLVFADWITNDQTTGRASARMMVLGSTTTAADMPRTGTANYAARLATSGVAPASGAGYDLYAASSATFSANFAAGTVATTLDLVGTPTGGAGPTRSFGNVSGAGMIDSGGPGFAGSLGGAGTTGAFAGALFGPQASEMAYVWYVTGGDFNAAGRVTGTRN